MQPPSKFFGLMSPKRSVFLFGRLGGGKVLTSLQLKKRGFHLASKCPFYGKKEEELEHILIHCPPVWGQWTDLLSSFGASLVPFFFWSKISFKASYPFMSGKKPNLCGGQPR